MLIGWDIAKGYGMSRVAKAFIDSELSDDDYIRILGNSIDCRLFPHNHENIQTCTIEECKPVIPFNKPDPENSLFEFYERNYPHLHQQKEMWLDELKDEWDLVVIGQSPALLQLKAEGAFDCRTVIIGTDFTVPSEPYVYEEDKPITNGYLSEERLAYWKKAFSLPSWVVRDPLLSTGPCSHNVITIGGEHKSIEYEPEKMFFYLDKITPVSVRRIVPGSIVYVRGLRDPYWKWILENRDCQVINEPVPLEQIREQKGWLHHGGGYFTISDCLRMGIPQRLLPLHYEQVLNAKALRKLQWKTA